MTTDLPIDPSPTTPEAEPPSPEPNQPSQEPTETVEELQEKLAAAKTEADRWKGRVEKLNEKKKKDAPVTTSDLDSLKWEISNEKRIELVRDEYEKIRTEGFLGEKVSDRIALELAEKQAKVDTSATRRSRSEDMSTPSVTMRVVDPQGYESEADRRLGLTAEKKRKLEAKYPHLKQD